MNLIAHIRMERDGGEEADCCGRGERDFLGFLVLGFARTFSVFTFSTLNVDISQCELSSSLASYGYAADDSVSPLTFRCAKIRKESC